MSLFETVIACPACGGAIRPLFRAPGAECGAEKPCGWVHYLPFERALAATIDDYMAKLKVKAKH